MNASPSSPPDRRDGPDPAGQDVHDVGNRIEDLLARMTTAEKIGQLNMPLPQLPEVAGFLAADHPHTLEHAAALAAGHHDGRLGPAGGFFALLSTLTDLTPRGQAEQHAALQAVARSTRLGIPLLQVAEGVHGLKAIGATVFPEGPGLGASFDADLIGAVYGVAATEARAIGVHVLQSLVVEPIRDPRLGRNCEGFTECPWWASRIAERMVRAVQVPGPDGPTVAASLTAFPGQSQPSGGMERGAMEVSERVLREVFLPPFAAAAGPGGALGIMATYAAIDGTPTHGSRRLLTDLLRGELGFTGVVFSEGVGFETLEYEGIVDSQTDAGLLGITAGVDVDITYERAYREGLHELLADGRLDPAHLDEAVRRVLRVKSALGLFDRPDPDPAEAPAVLGRAEHRDLALDAARAGCVLLNNGGALLPLRPDLRHIAVLGPHAAEVRGLLGDYVMAASAAARTTSVLDAVRAKAPHAVVDHAPGCAVTGEDRSGFAAAVEAARAAEVAIVVVGEQAGDALENLGDPDAPPATVGERFDVASLDLSGVQDELVRAVHATGTPTVVVLVNGRALTIGWIAEHVPAVLEAWLPGERGGEAVADILFGDHNPSGRLPVTVPRHVGQLPFTYDHKPSRRYGAATTGYVDLDASPLYAFGHGLSYTRFRYGPLRLELGGPGDDAVATAVLTVTNVGDRDGREVVQCYVHDVLSSVTTPVQQLRGVAVVPLAAGASSEVRFPLTAADLSLLDAQLRPVVEPGAFEVLVGSASDNIKSTAVLRHTAAGTWETS